MKEDLYASFVAKSIFGIHESEECWYGALGGDPEIVNFWMILLMWSSGL